MMPLSEFKLFLTALRDEAGAKLCGSMARGNYDIGHFSDIDFVVSDRKRKILTVIEIFKRFNVPGDSIIIGQWSSPRDKITLPRPVEVMSDSWIAPENYPAMVSVFNIDFPTFRRRFR